MVLKRGYELDEDEELFYDDPTLELFEEIYPIEEGYDALSRIYHHPEKGSLFVMYTQRVTQAHIGKDLAHLFIAELTKNRAERGIFITEQNLSLQAKQSLDSKGHFIQHFLHSELLVDVTIGQGVSEHELLSAEESKMYIKRMSEGLVGSSVVPSQMPKIFISEAVGKTKSFSSDPQAKYLGALPGEVIRITRINNYSETLVPAIIIHRIVY